MTLANGGFYILMDTDMLNHLVRERSGNISRYAFLHLVLTDFKTGQNEERYFLVLQIQISETFISLLLE
jgi:hypothetical protein